MLYECIKFLKDKIKSKKALQVVGFSSQQLCRISLSHGRYFRQFCGTVVPLLSVRAYTLQNAIFHICSYLYSGNFTISTVKSRYSHCFNYLKLFYEDRQYSKNGRFWPSLERLIPPGSIFYYNHFFAWKFIVFTL